MQGLQLVFAGECWETDRIVAMEKMSVDESLSNELENPPDMQCPAEDGATSSNKESLPAAASEPMSSENSEVSKDRPQNEINNPINREIRQPVDREPPRNVGYYERNIRNSRTRRLARRRARDTLGDFSLHVDGYLRDCDVREPPKYRLMRSRISDRARNEPNDIPEAESSAPSDPFRFTE